MKLTAVGPRMRVFTTRVHQFSTASASQQAPVVFVKGFGGPEERVNTLLGPSKRFPLPGDVCHGTHIKNTVETKVSTSTTAEANTVSLNSILSADRVDVDSNYLQELQHQAIEEAQQKAGDWPIELAAQSCPKLLKKDMKYLFPDVKVEAMNVTVLNLTQKSESDMSAWSTAMEEEREILTASFIASATAVCTTLRRCGYWADFVDPSSGRPYLGRFSNHALFETDDAYRQMGFRIEDLGCCKVLKHVSWGTHAFVGTMFTDAPMESEIVKDILSKVNDDSAVEEQ